MVTMSDAPITLPDGTLTFLPERLNRDPAVLRGLTNDEMWVALIVGAVLGVVLGAPLAVDLAGFVQRFKNLSRALFRSLGNVGYCK